MRNQDFRHLLSKPQQPQQHGHFRRSPPSPQHHHPSVQPRRKRARLHHHHHHHSSCSYSYPSTVTTPYTHAPRHPPLPQISHPMHHHHHQQQQQQQQQQPAARHSKSHSPQSSPITHDRHRQHRWIQYRVGPQDAESVVYFDPVRKWFTRHRPPQQQQQQQQQTSAAPVFDNEGGTLRVVEKRPLQLVRTDEGSGPHGARGCCWLLVTLSNGVRFLHDTGAMESHWTLPPGWEWGDEEEGEGGKQGQERLLQVSAADTSGGGGGGGGGDDDHDARGDDGGGGSNGSQQDSDDDDDDIEFEVIHDDDDDDDDDQREEEEGSDVEFEVIIDDETGEAVDVGHMRRVVLEERAQAATAAALDHHHHHHHAVVPRVEEEIVVVVLDHHRQQQQVVDVVESDGDHHAATSDGGLQGDSTPDAKGMAARMEPQDAIQVQDQRDREDQKALFLALLDELGVGPFSKWDDYVGDMQADERFRRLCTRLPIVERKTLFAEYVQDRERDEEERERKEKQAAMEAYQDLLEEASPVILSERLTFRRFAERFGQDPRFRQCSEMQKKELMFMRHSRAMKRKR